MNTDELKKEIESNREQMLSQLLQMEKRITTLEVTLWGRGGENGVRGAINDLRRKMDIMLRFFWVATATPAIAVAVIAILKFVGKIG
jgi:hypothetical protein